MLTCNKFRSNEDVIAETMPYSRKKIVHSAKLEVKSKQRSYNHCIVLKEIFINNTVLFVRAEISQPIVNGELRKH